MLNENVKSKTRPNKVVLHSAANIQSWLSNRGSTDSWTLNKRLDWLAGLDWGIQENQGVICKTVATDKGVSVENVLMNEYTPIRLLINYYRRNAKRILADEDRSQPFSASFGAKRVLVKKEPFGVVGIISPFNYPFALALGPIIAAIITGNGVIFKPSPETSATNILIRALLRSSLRGFKAEELFSMLSYEVEYGQALVAESLVNKIHFTGSVKAGRAVAEANARVRFIPPTLELGGSNAAIVLEDADLEETAEVIAWSRFCGLSCNSIKRVFVVAPVYENFKDLLTKKIREINPHERLTKIPVREEKNYTRFLDEYACSRPSTVAVALHKDGECAPVACFMDKYDRKLAMLNEETFCPVLPVVPVDDEQMAVRYANDTQSGLGASIFTKDDQKFKLLAGQLNCGTVCQNDALTEFAQPQVPFGGWKDSGHGYTHGPEGLLDFTQKKTVILEPDNLKVKIIKKLRFRGLRLWKLQLYPWTDRKLAFLRRWIDTIIDFS